jgi:bifunctional non-homologous end joining protein LigD
MTLTPNWRESARDVQPMLATLADGPLTDEQFVYEPKYDGIRALVEIEGTSVRFWSRLGNDKTGQFPELVKALSAWAAAERPGALLLDGEIVAVDAHGEPIGFHALQSRIHLRGTPRNAAERQAVAIMFFDILRDGVRDVRGLPLTARRARLERLLVDPGSDLIRLSDQVAGNGAALFRTARARGWEGIVAKRASSLYRSGTRGPDWLKIKITHQQEFVVGGWTEPTGTRSHFGALLLGVYEGPSTPLRTSPSAALRAGTLVYVGHVGSGFNERELDWMARRLKTLASTTSPFAERPPSNQRPHWIRPDLVVEVRFNEWTPDGRLRAPVYLGVREDKKAEDVRREDVGISQGRRGPTPAGSRSAARRLAPRAGRRRSSGDLAESPKPAARSLKSDPSIDAIIDQLKTLESARRSGPIELPGGETLQVTNLHKVFWPTLRKTKGDLLRYYARVAHLILPVVADRALVMRRFPNGVNGKAFYQQRAPSPIPPGIRVETLPNDDVPSRLVGGSLATLLYMAQIAAISQDPWLSRIDAPDTPDHVVLDLDPMPGVPFARVLDVARWIHDELEMLGATGMPKTSGADGLHIYLPLPPDVPYEAGMLFCRIVATVVARKHPRWATVERKVQVRGAKVYVDYLQNIRGKTLATAYSARASAYAGVSMPVTWKEIDDGLDPHEFTIDTAPARLATIGDLWKKLRTAKPIDLRRVSRYTDER